MGISSLQLTVFGIVILISYLIGNISPAIIIGKINKQDIRETGSHNAGTTNVLRTFGKKAAAITMIVDILKGVIPVIIARYVAGQFLSIHFANHLALWAGVFAICGHIWPVVFGFKGGKGVATTFGVLITAMPFLGLCELGIMLVTVAVTKMVSLGAVLGALAFPLLVSKLEPMYLPQALCLTLMILYKHNENIGRIVRGEENKISLKK
ncbi:MAG: glycerol-3-phosphate 1-O-acyltransferase PlsY [Eubacteriales bacterium]